MQIRSSHTLIAISAAIALGAAAVAPTAVLAKGPGPRADGCSGDCAADPVATQQQDRSRDGSGDGARQRARQQATATEQARTKGAGGQNIKTQAGKVQARASDRGRMGENGNSGGGAGKGNPRQTDGSTVGGRGREDGTLRGPGSCDGCDVEMGTLTEADIEGLVFMANEEKLAHDVYVAFSERYDLPVFERIAASEARHQAAVDTLLERYGIEDGTSGLREGEFSDPSMQELYAELTEQGSAGLDEALAAAVLIEKTDIADLELRMKGLDETAPDVHLMYGNLLQGSRNHLSAFERQS